MMKKHYYSCYKTLTIIGTFQLIIQVSYSQQNPPIPYSNTKVINSVQTWIPSAPDVNPNNVILRSVKDVNLSTQFIDGLNRKIQNVVKMSSFENSPTNPGSSLNAVDMVTATVFDEFGLEKTRYLRFPTNNTGSNNSLNDGNFKSNPFQQQVAFYNSQLSGQNGETNIGVNNLNWAYIQKEYEASPLNRLTKLMSPGVNWVGTNRGVEYKYWLNTSVDDVKKWSVLNVTNSFGTYQVTGAYSSGELNKSVTIDEKGKQTIEFKDKQGRLILKKVQLTSAQDVGLGKNHDGWLCTYFIYDELNNLRCVVSPKATELISPSFVLNDATILSELCFRYEYDDRKRMVVKAVPGAGDVWMVYDTRDRMVLSQDANMRNNSTPQWQYFIYDNLNRVVSIGLWNNSDNRIYHQSHATGSVYPDLNGQTIEELATTFYDDYGWLSQFGSPLTSTYDNTFDTYFQSTTGNTWPYPQRNLKSDQVKGLATGSRIKVLGSGNYLYSVNLFNDKGLIIQNKSTNISGGTNVNTIQYTWSGKQLIVVDKIEEAVAPAQVNVIVTQNTYDDLFRLIKVEKKVANSILNNSSLSFSTISSIEYDQLGQVKKKTLGSKKDPQNNNEYYSPRQSLANLSYQYNIRGWLLSMNKDYLSQSNNNGDQYFAMELGYDKDGTEGSFVPAYNGIISGTIWKSEGDQEKRKYDYSYDAANRFMKADFNQKIGSSWTNSPVDLKVIMGDGSDPSSAYDANGNIKKMQTWGLQINNSAKIDELDYTYLSNSNKLQNVRDNVNVPASTGGDFKTSSLHPHYTDKVNAVTEILRNGITDYAYDFNGNLDRDFNKDIGNESNKGIAYNFLNLPATVTFKSLLSINGKGFINYVYDASGNKLRKTVTEKGLNITYNNNNYLTDIITSYDYLHGLVFQSKSYSDGTLNSALGYSSKLQTYTFEDGRVRGLYNSNVSPNTLTGLAYDFLIKDNIGNTRAVLTEELKNDVYPEVTFESGSSADEQKYYENAGVSITAKPGNFNTGTNGSSVQLLSKGIQSIGAGKLAKVMAGDKLHIKVDYYTPSGTVDNSGADGLNTILNSLMNLLNAPSTAGLSVHGNGLDIKNNLNSNPTFTGFLSSQTSGGSTSSSPKAYLNVIFFDEQFKFINQGSLTVQIQTMGGSGDHIFLLNGSARTAPKNGYVYIYVNNESNNMVYFDNLQVIHERGPIIEEDHYYPYGLKIAGISSKAAERMENKIHFMGKETQDNEFTDGGGLEWSDFGDRMYDFQIGRWNHIDSKSEKYMLVSPYAFTSNNPLLFVDRDGDDVYFGIGWQGSSYQAVYDNLIKNSASFRSLITTFEAGKAINLSLNYASSEFVHPASGFVFNPIGEGVIGNTQIDKLRFQENGSEEPYSKVYNAYSFFIPEPDKDLNDLGRALTLLHEVTHAWTYNNASKQDFEIDGHNNQRGEGVLAQYLFKIQDGIREYAKENNITLEKWDVIALSISGVHNTNEAADYAIEFAKDVYGVTLTRDSPGTEINKYLDILEAKVDKLIKK
jgi:RHS repeat-associated protein